MTSTDKVKQFHETFEHPIGNLQTLEPLKIRQLRIKLLFEELRELAEAGDVGATFHKLCSNSTEQDLAELDTLQDGDNVNQIEELDAITDIQYVLDGKKLTSGLYEVCDQAFDLIHENNMQKAHRNPLHVVETENKTGITLQCIERNGVFIAQNPDGKTIKPWDHKKVDLSILFKKD